MVQRLKITTRKAERKNCRMLGKLKYMNAQTDARIIDLSTVGAAVEVKGPVYAASGSKVRLEAGDLGILEGIVRWMHNGRLGIQFDVNSNARAQIASYFRFFHREVPRPR